MDPNTESLRVIQNPAIYKLPGLLDRSQELFAPDLGGIEILVPLEQVFNEGMDGAIASLLEVGHVQPKAPAAHGIVGQGAVGNQGPMIVAELRSRHAERPKYVLLGEVAQRF